MGSFFQVVSIVLLIVVKSRAVTDIELVYLLNTRQFTNDQVAIFQISNITSDKYVVTISGEPTFVEGGCYNTSLGCCLPNTDLRPQTEQVFTIPRRPRVANVTYCAPQGPVGVSIGGVVFHNHFEENCMDVNRFVVGNFDSCNGQRNFLGEYHFHRAPAPDCVEAVQNNQPHIIGVALDGFPIYSSNMYNGTAQELDECGGFMIDRDNYRYVASYSASNPTDHVIPCFKGIPLKPRCCECLECNREQLPGCQRRRPPFSPIDRGMPNQGNSRFSGRPPRGFSFGGPRRFGQRPNRGGSRPNVDRSMGQRLNRTGLMIPEFEPQEGFCSRDQLMMLFQMFSPFGEAVDNCTGCMECVPEGGYSSVEDALRCRRCRVQMEITAQVGTPSPNRFGNRRPSEGRRGGNFLFSFLLGR